MKHIFHIDRSERVVVAMALAVLLPLHWLMVAKFAPLLMHYDVDTWRTFMRNYHMSGFDPIVYHASTACSSWLPHCSWRVAWARC